MLYEIMVTRKKQKRGRPPLEGGGEQVYFKASEALMLGLEKYLKQQRALQPGLAISRASIIRDLLLYALQRRT
jgi:hypothetical protein